MPSSHSVDMAEDADRSALLRLEIGTLWPTDDRGRLLRHPLPLSLPAPLLAVAASPYGCCWASSAELSDDLDASIGELLDAEHTEEVGWSPAAASEIVAALASAGFETVGRRGPSYLVDRPRRRPTTADIRTGDDGNRDALRGHMPEDDRLTLRAPWAAALVEGRVAAVCETARSTRAAAEAGVWTYEPYRRRGLAAAVTAAWAGLVTGRTAFYSTTDDNQGSMAVARWLDLSPLGQWWILEHGTLSR